MVNILHLSPKGVLHVGAHTAEEWPEYQKFGWTPIIWVEAQPELAKRLVERLPVELNTVIEGVVWSKPGIPMKLQVSNNTASTSLLDFHTHRIEHPDIVVESTLNVTTTTLEEIIPSNLGFEMLVIDIQGAELEALKGFSQRLKSVKWVYSEVNRKELYKECAKVSEIDAFLSEHGFNRKITRWTIHGWGDALYVNVNFPESLWNFKQRLQVVIMRLYWVTLNLRHRAFLIVKGPQVRP
jgi:FkbM family methyltransferase